MRSCILFLLGIFLSIPAFTQATKAIDQEDDLEKILTLLESEPHNFVINREVSLGIDQHSFSSYSTFKGKENLKILVVYDQTDSVIFNLDNFKLLNSNDTIKVNWQTKINFSDPSRSFRIFTEEKLYLKKGTSLLPIREYYSLK
jgi:hypothetical protein